MVTVSFSPILYCYNSKLLILNFFYCFISGHEHLKLIFDFSVWVLKAHPDDGLKVKLVV